MHWHLLNDDVVGVISGTIISVLFSVDYKWTNLGDYYYYIRYGEKVCVEARDVEELSPVKRKTVEDKGGRPHIPLSIEL